ncbi:MAG: hypothetical protein ACRC5A_16315 [Enterobacteriaceae bacterium]
MDTQNPPLDHNSTDENKNPDPENPPAIKEDDPNPSINLPMPTVQFTQLGVLLIDDQIAGNQYVTTLESSGSTLPESLPVALFGVRHSMGRNQHLAAWYPHTFAKDIVRINSAEPSQAFSGLLDNHHNSHYGDPVSITPIPKGYSNLLLSDLAFTRLQQMDIGSSHTLALQEQLENGGLRLVQSVINKQAHLILRRPNKINCHDEQVSGIQGKSCLIREITLQDNALQNSDLQFIMRARSALPQAHYRVGQQWHPFGTPISVSEFTGSHGIEIFLPAEDPSANGTAQDRQTLAGLLEAGFFSSSRHSRGDFYGLTFSHTPLPQPEETINASRLEVLLINDQVGDTQYVTTLTRSSARGRGQQSVLFGVRNPGAGERNAIWYTNNSRLRSVERPLTVEPQLSPAQSFSGFAARGGTPQSEPSELPMLSDAGWQALSSLSQGDSQLWRFDAERANQRQQILSHIVKGGELQFARPSSYHCQAQKINGLNGQICRIREIQWRGAPVMNEELRFVVQSKKETMGMQYRVGQNWHPLASSITLAEFSGTQGLDLFLPDADESAPALRTMKSDPTLSELIKMKFMLPMRASQGDQFTLHTDSTPLPLVNKNSPSDVIPLTLLPLKAERSPVKVGEPVSIKIDFNRPLKEKENLYIRLNVKEKKGKESAIQWQTIRLNKQEIELREGAWLTVSPEERGQHYSLHLLTNALSEGGDYLLQVSLKDPQQLKGLTRSALEEDLVRQLPLTIQGWQKNSDDSMYIFQSRDGIRGYYGGQATNSVAAMLSVRFNYTMIPLDKSATIQIKQGNSKTMRLRQAVMVSYPSQVQQTFPREELFRDTFELKTGAMGFDILIDPSAEVTQTMGWETFPLTLTATLNDGHVITLNYELIIWGSKSNHAFSRINSLTPQPELVEQGGESTFLIKIDPAPNEPDTHQYGLSCKNTGSQNVFTNNKQYGFRNRDGKIQTITFDSLSNLMNRSQLHHGSIELKVKSDAPRNTTASVECHIYTSQMVLNRDVRGSVRVITPGEAVYKIKEILKTVRDGEVDFSVLMNSKPLQPGGKQIFYRLYQKQPGDLLNKPSLQVNYRNQQGVNPSPARANLSAQGG